MPYCANRSWHSFKSEWVSLPRQQWPQCCFERERGREREEGKVVWREWGLSDTRRGQRLKQWQPQWRPADRHWADMSCWRASDPGKFLCTLTEHTHTHTHTVHMTACIHTHNAATWWCTQCSLGHTPSCTHTCTIEGALRPQTACRLGATNRLPKQTT